ncbi:helix-turn-helix transcriptional regulator [Caballeronia novacaledonica]|uniref:Helix-turn-helix transcriptional regulator n=1 Tax=Caballeronia novacaledonica TaxID=1544861 RepID=A0AA37MU05_9BURK|nr:helix-turn-helix domain-containing protein [Caballeronia novacaledonica]GJH28394.1 helix-turn-helix transcriptional regulator [Caballeronia novacaledonica]
MDADLIHKALANPLRREILAWLKAPEGFTHAHAAFDGGVPLSAIQARSGLSQSTVSAHVASMVEAGLLVSTRAGSFLLLSRNEEVIAAFVRQVARGL